MQKLNIERNDECYVNKFIIISELIRDYFIKYLRRG